ncbi:MAG: 4-phosphoerythronate dehydrogenase PdxB [Bacteroides sp.]|nr:4-phosphoerythronate dehydrogenase PdxB [Bacteroides sp.]
MKAVIDDKIPYIHGEIEKIADTVVYLPGRDISPEIVKDADLLIIRTRTRCGKELLEGSRVKFIATATIGYDHIDTAWCEENGIYWTNAPGCNSGSVAQYLTSVLILWKQGNDLAFNNLTIGIIGVGNVGRKVAQVAQELGMKVLLNDPPRARKEGGKGFVPLETLMEQCDILTFHTPLTRSGEDPTYHLADSAFFARLPRKPLLINTSRGEVIETEALKKALEKGQIAGAVIDVWKKEPDIDLDLLDKVCIATPHIAGYSADGKANATRMSLEAAARFFNLPVTFCVEPPAPQQPDIYAQSFEEAYLMMYDPCNDDSALRTAPGAFELLRGNYPLRREKEAYKVEITS